MDYDSFLHLKIFLLLVLSIRLASSTVSGVQDGTQDTKTETEGGENVPAQQTSELQTTGDVGKQEEMSPEAMSELKQIEESLKGIEEEATKQVARGQLVLRLTGTVKKLQEIKHLPQEKRSAEFKELDKSWNEAKEIFTTCSQPPEPKVSKPLDFKGFIAKLNVFQQKSIPHEFIAEGCSIESLSHKLAGDTVIQEMVSMIDNALLQHKQAEEKATAEKAVGAQRRRRRKRSGAIGRTAKNAVLPGYITYGTTGVGAFFLGGGGAIGGLLTGYAITKTIAATWFTIGQIIKYTWCTIPCFFGKKICNSLKFRIPPFFRKWLGLNTDLPEHRRTKQRNAPVIAEKGKSRLHSLKSWRGWIPMMKKKNRNVSEETRTTNGSSAQSGFTDRNRD